MKLQINNFLQDGVEDIFIRDFSFLGFPVYRIYIPDYSTSHYTVCERILKNYKDGTRIIKSIIIDNKQTISSKENKILQEVFSHKSYIGTWIIRDIKESYLDLLYASLVKDVYGENVAVELIYNINEDFSLAIQEDRHMTMLNRNEAYKDKMILLFYGEFISEVVSAWRNNNSFISLCLLLKKCNYSEPPYSKMKSG